jgi:hypothetical protein
MFKKFTVMVIGAGAGVDVLMPTGEKLTGEIERKLNIRSRQGDLASGDAEVARAIAMCAQNGADRLFETARTISMGIHHTKSIDNFCHTHRHDPNVQTVAKIAIVHSILKAENGSPLYINRSKHPARFRNEGVVRESWFQSFTHVLQDGTDASTNLKDIFKNLIIINFNYDRCVEHYLNQMLQELYGINAGASAELMKKLNICHPYGTVGLLPWQDGEGPKVEFGEDGLDAKKLGLLAKNIRTYNEELPQSDQLQIFKTIMADAVRYIFLGFHFHKQNVELITAIESKQSVRHAYATTIGRSESDLGVIESRIRTMLPGSRQLYCGVDRKLDCKGLFTEYGTSFEI